MNTVIAALPKLDGFEISDGVFIVGEPIPIPNSNKMHAIVNLNGVLMRAELSLNFAKH